MLKWRYEAVIYPYFMAIINQADPWSQVDYLPLLHFLHLWMFPYILSNFIVILLISNNISNSVYFNVLYEGGLFLFYMASFNVISNLWPV